MAAAAPRKGRDIKIGGTRRKKRRKDFERTRRHSSFWPFPSSLYLSVFIPRFLCVFFLPFLSVPQSIVGKFCEHLSVLFCSAVDVKKTTFLQPEKLLHICRAINTLQIYIVHLNKKTKEGIPFECMVYWQRRTPTVCLNCSKKRARTKERKRKIRTYNCARATREEIEKEEKNSWTHIASTIIHLLFWHFLYLEAKKKLCWRDREIERKETNMTKPTYWNVNKSCC